MLSSQQQLDLEAETVSITTTFEVGVQSMQQGEQQPQLRVASATEQMAQAPLSEVEVIMSLLQRGCALSLVEARTTELAPNLLLLVEDQAIKPQ